MAVEHSHRQTALVVLAFGLCTAVAAGQVPTTQPGRRLDPRIALTRLRAAKGLTGNWGGYRQKLEDSGIDIGLTWQSLYQQNYRGGLNTHNALRYTDSYDLAVELDFEKLGLIPGGSFYLKAKGGSNMSLNADEVGALNNVNADPYESSIFVRKWWYRQQFFDDRIDIRVGRIQTHKDLFDTSIYANHEDEDFLNRGSFRNHLITHDAAIGAFARVWATDWLYVQAAALDAQVESRTRTGFDTAFHDEDWFYGLFELGLSPEWETAKGKMPGHYRVGCWYDPLPKEVFQDDLDGERPPKFETQDVGFYLGLDQMVWKENDKADDKQGLGVFARYGGAHGSVNEAAHYWQAGVSRKGLIPTRDQDVTAFAFTQLIMSRPYRDHVEPRADRESVYEWYYLIQVTPWFTITPDIQLITNPGGNKDDRDAIVGAVRFRIIF